MPSPIVDYVENMDLTDLQMIGDKTIDALVRDWGLVSHIDAEPKPGTEYRCGNHITIEAEITVVFTDAGRATVRTIVKGSDADDVFGLINISIMQVPA